MKKVAEGIYQIEIGLPEVGGLNLYFLDGDIPCLLETGPNLPAVKETIEAGLLQVGRRLRDLRRIIVTHGHIDHYGLAGLFSQISGAEVLMSRPEQDLMFNFQNGAIYEQVAQCLPAWGVPARLGAAILKYIEFLTGLGTEVDPAYFRSLATGDIIEAGQLNWRVQCCAGHSPAGLCLFDQQGLVFTGDHILAKISPNPDLDLTKKRIMQGGLKEYVSSFMDLDMEPVELALPSHGPLINQFRNRIDSLKTEINKRRLVILAIVEKWPKSIFQIGEELLLRLGRKSNASQIWLAVREVKSHLDMLETEMLVKMVKVKGVCCYYQLA